MILLSMLKTLGVVEWALWFITIFFSIKGYMEYPNILNETPKSETSYDQKPSFQ